MLYIMLYSVGASGVTIARLYIDRQTDRQRRAVLMVSIGVCAVALFIARSRSAFSVCVAPFAPVRGPSLCLAKGLQLYLYSSQLSVTLYCMIRNNYIIRWYHFSKKTNNYRNYLRYIAGAGAGII